MSVTESAERAATEQAATELRAGSVRSRVTRPFLARLGSFPMGSEQDLRLVQDRLALFAQTTFFVSLGFLIATTTSDLVSDVKRYTDASRLWHVVGTLIALALWRLTASRRALSPDVLATLNIVGTLGICWCFTLMAHAGIQPHGFYTGLLAVTHVSISRAMIVPSIPQQTLWLGAVSFAGFVVSRSLMPWPIEIERIAGSRGRGVFEAALWATAGTVVSTIASQVIYGLRKKVREAKKLGQYALEQKIGQGGMGEVYRARHAMLRRPTAVKLLSGDGSEEQLRRFEKEVQLTARLTHPNTISIYDYGRTPDGIFYYAMELLEGLTLEQLVERHGPLPAARAIHILRQVCGALREAHGSGLIHRDIKPANVFLCWRGDIPDFVKVLDFGLVRQIANDGDATRSNVDAVVGTPLYLSPEAIVTPDRIDARADIYGLGGVAYTLITGGPPFTGQNLVEVCAHHLHSQPEPPSVRAPVPDDLERVILACLAKAPESRPESAEALSRALAECRDANRWSDADARTWWARFAPASSAEPEQGSTPSGVELRRTIVRADLEVHTDEGP